jgi:hypothetical protein
MFANNSGRDEHVHESFVAFNRAGEMPKLRLFLRRLKCLSERGLRNGSRKLLGGWCRAPVARLDS